MAYTVALNTEIAAAAGPILYAYRVPRKGRLIRFFSHFYQGQARELQLRMRIQGQRHGQELFQPIRAEAGVPNSIASLLYLCGDDTTLDYPLDIPLEVGDYVVWEYTNVDAVNALHTNSFIQIQEE